MYLIGGGWHVGLYLNFEYLFTWVMLCHENSNHLWAHEYLGVLKKELFVRLLHFDKILHVSEINNKHTFFTITLQFLMFPSISTDLCVFQYMILYYGYGQVWSLSDLMSRRGALLKLSCFALFMSCSSNFALACRTT